VALVDYNVAWAQETKRMIDEEGGISEVIQAVEKTIELFGKLHILVNIGRSRKAIGLK
jgi:hypothetical protein